MKHKVGAEIKTLIQSINESLFIIKSKYTSNFIKKTCSYYDVKIKFC